MGKGKQLIANSILYAIGNFGSKILTFLVVPLYTYYIDTSDMGTYDVVITAVSLLAPIIVFSIYEGVYRWSVQDTKAAGRFIQYGWMVELRNLAVFSVLYLLAGMVIQIPYFEVTLLYIIVLCVHTYLARVTRALGNTKLFALMGILYTVVYLGCNVLFIVICHYGVVSFLWSGFLGYLCTAVIMIIVQQDIMHKGPSSERLDSGERRKILQYSLAITPNDICWWIVGLSDRFALVAFLSASANGIYSISQKFPTIISMLTSIFYMAWQDQSVSDYSSSEKDAYYTMVFEKYSRLLLCGSLCILPITKQIILLLMEASYHSAWQYVMPLYIGTVFSALSSFLGVGYLGSKETHKALYTTVLAAITNIGINLIFIPLFPQYGIFIASISTFVSYFVLFITRAIQTRQYFKITYHWGEIAALVGTNIAMGIVMMYTSLIVDVILTMIAVGIAVWLMRSELTAIISKVLKKK